jgi:uncharacterized membrane protein
VSRVPDPYEEPRAPAQRTGMDAFFGNTNIVLLIILAVCCNGIAVILGIVGLITCKDPQAKNNALIVTIIGGIITALAVIGNIVATMGGHR